MEIIEIIQAACTGVVSLALGYLVFWASSYLKKKRDEVKELLPLQGNTVVDGLFEVATGVITKVAAASVGKLEQIIGKDLRELVKAGKADKTELYALAEDAYRDVVDTVAPEVMNDLKNYIGNTELYIRNIIETELLKLKSATKA